MSLAGKRIVVIGSAGFLGRHIGEVLKKRGLSCLEATHARYELTEQADVRRLYRELKPQVVFQAAGLVGGIQANVRRPADFFHRNLLMGTLLMHEAYAAGVEKYIGLMCGCAYPDHAPNPIREDSLWDGSPTPTSAPYGLAKRMLAVQAAAYRRQHGFNAITLVPGNVYGPFENFHLDHAHVIPALVRKFVEARRRGDEVVTVWGSGSPRRDFIFAGDAAEGIVKAAESYDEPELINISSGATVTIREVAELVRRLAEYGGRIEWDQTKPDGQMEKGFDVSRMRTVLRYEPPTSLEEGLKRTLDWFTAHEKEARL